LPALPISQRAATGDDASHKKSLGAHFMNIDRIVLAASMLLAFTGAAGAQQLPFSAYVDVHGGANGGHQAGTFNGGSESYSDKWRDIEGGVSVRAALGLTPTVSAQFDAWTEAWHGRETDWDTVNSTNEYDYSGNRFGVGGHLTFRPSTDNLWGFLVSTGPAGGDSTFVTTAIEGAHDFAAWRLYAQGGLSFGATGDASTYNAQQAYGVLVANYYFTPDFALTGSVGYARATSTGTRADLVSLGGRLERKFASLPLSTYVQYQGWFARATTTHRIHGTRRPSQSSLACASRSASRRCGHWIRRLA
jgi:hypothetical protein